MPRSASSALAPPACAKIGVRVGPGEMLFTRTSPPGNATRPASGGADATSTRAERSRGLRGAMRDWRFSRRMALDRATERACFGVSVLVLARARDGQCHGREACRTHGLVPNIQVVTRAWRSGSDGINAFTST